MSVPLAQCPLGSGNLSPASAAPLSPRAVLTWPTAGLPGRSYCNCAVLLRPGLCASCYYCNSGESRRHRPGRSVRWAAIAPLVRRIRAVALQAHTTISCSSRHASRAPLATIALQIPPHTVRSCFLTFIILILLTSFSKRTRLVPRVTIARTAHRSRRSSPVQRHIQQSDRYVGSNDCKVCPPGQYCRHWLVNQRLLPKRLLLHWWRSVRNRRTIPLAASVLLVPSAGLVRPLTCPPVNSARVTSLVSRLATACRLLLYRVFVTPAYWQLAGDRCPAGYYALPVSSPYGCPTGTMSNSLGNQDQANCTACTAGQYCAQPNVTTPTGPCSAGYFCVAGSIVPTPAAGLCPAGKYCPPASPSPLICDPGQYQDETGKSICKTCPAGYYCNGVNSSTYFNCPMGHFCPAGTRTPTEFACPAGTYGNQTNYQNQSQCIACPPGSYCAGTGKTTTTGPCSAGYYCTGGAFSPTPTDNSTGAICPAGSYCGIGSYAPTPCDAGYYTPNTGNSGTFFPRSFLFQGCVYLLLSCSGVACFPCPPGRHCASVDLSVA